MKHRKAIFALLRRIVIFQLAIYELRLRLLWMDRAEITRDAAVAIVIVIVFVIIERKMHLHL